MEATVTKSKEKEQAIEKVLSEYHRRFEKLESITFPNIITYRIEGKDMFPLGLKLMAAGAFAVSKD